MGKNRKNRGKLLLLLLPLALTVWAAAAGDAADPLASLSYLNGVFTSAVDAAVNARLDASDALLLENGGSGAEAPAVPASSASGWTELRLKQGDLLPLSTGESVLLLAGSAQFTCAFGEVVDASAGTVVPSGGALSANHRYIAAEDTSAGVLITSKTAVVDRQGTGAVSNSGATDYNAIAGALKSLGLFRGSLTGYGQGYDLEAAPTRLQALIMFIRVLGEEEAALAWTGETPFTDLQRGSQGEKYVGYAYERGYTNGYSATEFRPSAPVNAWQYTEFILRALGYSSPANTNLSDALLRAQDAGVLTPGEAAMLQSDPFLRADLVYVSYYALDALRADGMGTLAEALMEKGVFTQWERDSAAGMVTGWRL